MAQEDLMQAIRAVMRAEHIAEATKIPYPYYSAR